MSNFDKKMEDFQRLFSLIPFTLMVFKYLQDERETLLNFDKKNRYNYLSNIYNQLGIEKYYNIISKDNPDFYYCAEPSFLFHFENINQLNEWIISGTNLKHQNIIFNSNNNDESSSEEDFIDSP